MKLLFAPGARFGIILAAVIVPGIAGLATASTTVHPPGLALVVEDAYGRECDTPGGEFACLGRHEPGSAETVGDDVTSLETGPVRARAELRPREVPIAGPVLGDALPQESYSVRFDEVGVELPLVPAYGKLRASAGPFPTDSVAGADVSEERMTWWHLWLQPSRTDRGVYTQAYTNPWNDSTGLFDYTHVRYPGQVANGSSDDAFPLLRRPGVRVRGEFHGMGVRAGPPQGPEPDTSLPDPRVQDGVLAESAASAPPSFSRFRRSSPSRRVA